MPEAFADKDVGAEPEQATERSPCGAQDEQACEGARVAVISPSERVCGGASSTQWRPDSKGDGAITFGLGS